MRYTFRDSTDSKFKDGILEIDSEIEALLNKIRMIFFTEKGEVMGYPEFGMDLEDYLFNFDINEGVIRDRFYAQLGAYVPERNYQIDIEFERQDFETSNVLVIYITVNGQRVMGIST